MKNFLYLSFVFFILFPQLLFNCFNKFTDCFNCSTCGLEDINLEDCLCQWNSDNNKCNDITSKKDIIYSYEVFTQCTDTQSKFIQEKYCGLSNLEINNELTFSMPLVDGNYGTKSVYCNYTFSISHEKNIYYNINYKYASVLSNNNILNDVHLYLDVQYNNLSRKIIELLDEDINSDFKEVQLIEFRIYFEQSLISLPFTFQIKELYEPYTSYTIYIILGVVIGFFALASTICILTKKAAEKIRQRQRTLFEIQLARQYGEGNGDEMTQRKKSELLNKRKIIYILQQSQNNKKIIKNKTLKGGNICSICLEKIKLQSKISITNCHHIFHYKCLSNWLLRDLTEPKCPNCKYDLIKDVSENDIYEVLVVNTETAYPNNIMRLNSARCRKNTNRIDAIFNDIAIDSENKESNSSKNTVDDSPSNFMRIKNNKNPKFVNETKSK